MPLRCALYNLSVLIRSMDLIFLLLQGRALSKARELINVRGRSCETATKTDTVIVCTVDFGSSLSWYGYDHLVELGAHYTTPWPDNLWHLYWDLDGQGVPPDATYYHCPDNECSTTGGYLLTIQGSGFGTDPSALSVDIEVRSLDYHCH